MPNYNTCPKCGRKEEVFTGETDSEFLCIVCLERIMERNEKKIKRK